MFILYASNVLLMESAFQITSLFLFIPLHLLHLVHRCHLPSEFLISTFSLHIYELVESGYKLRHAYHLQSNPQLLIYFQSFGTIYASLFHASVFFLTTPSAGNGILHSLSKSSFHSPFLLRLLHFIGN